MSLGGDVAERVELAQLIGQLRQELSAAMREGRCGVAGKPLISGSEQAGER